jgi:hypothetical protein
MAISWSSLLERSIIGAVWPDDRYGACKLSGRGGDCIFDILLKSGTHEGHFDLPSSSGRMPAHESSKNGSRDGHWKSE